MVSQFPSATFQLPFVLDQLYDVPDAATFAEEHPNCAFLRDPEGCLAILVHPISFDDTTPQITISQRPKPDYLLSLPCRTNSIVSLR
jgi:hypothetical protein